ISQGPVLYFDEEWEGLFSTYTTIIYDGLLYRAYYRGLPSSSNHGGIEETTCVAISIDGINWIKPELGKYEIAGSKDNNVILANDEGVTHNFSPFIDKNPKAKSNEKFKAIGGHLRKGGLFVYTSTDGFHWKRYHQEAVITDGIFDFQKNVAF